MQPGIYLSAGPYIVSHNASLSDVTQFPQWYLYQDLSRVMPKVVFSYAKAFFNQAAKVRYWEVSTVTDLALNLQNILYVTAAGFSDVTVAMNDAKDMVKLVEQNN